MSDFSLSVSVVCGDASQRCSSPASESILIIVPFFCRVAMNSSASAWGSASGVTLSREGFEQPNVTSINKKMVPAFMPPILTSRAANSKQLGSLAMRVRSC